MSFRYNHAALGGTFDHLHAGHKHLLKSATEIADHLTIGLTTETMIHVKDYAQLIEPYALREKSISKQLKYSAYTKRTQIIPLHDIYGTTLTDASIDVIVVTKLTKKGALEINKSRQEKNLPVLPIEVVDLISDEVGEYISSSRIRGGKINRSGMVYQNIFRKDIILTNSQKQAIRTPQGNLLQEHDLTPEYLAHYTKVYLIGDVVTQLFIDKQLPFHLAIIDNLSQQQPYPHDFSNYLPHTHQYANNPAGTISEKAAATIHDMLHLGGLLEIQGEEDLLGFPVALNAPLNSLLIYGQKDQGMVGVHITEKNKSSLASLLAT